MGKLLIDKEVLIKDLKLLRRTKVWTDELVSYVNEIIEVCYHATHEGDEQEKEEMCQAAWLHAVSIVEKINLKKNAYAYIQTCVRNFFRSTHKKMAKQITTVDIEDFDI